MRALLIAALLMIAPGCVLTQLQNAQPSPSSDDLGTGFQDTTAAFWILLQDYAASTSSSSQARALVQVSGSSWIVAGSAHNGTSVFATLFQFDVSTGVFGNASTYQFAAGEEASITSLAKAASGNLFSAGTGKSGGVENSILLMSTDNGATWSARANYQLVAGQAASSQAIAAVPGGALLWAHSASDGTSRKWVVRRSTDDGASWTEVDNTALEAGALAEPRSIHAVSATQWIVVGTAIQAGTRRQWTRSTINSGGAWTAVAYQLEAGADARANGVGADSSGNYFVVGDATSSGSLHWTVRKSTDQGATWTVLDDYQPQAGKDASASAVAVTSSGKIQVSGYAIRPDATRAWIARETSTTGTTTFIDDYQLERGKDSECLAYAIGSDGVQVSAGRAVGTETSDRWVVRKLSPTP